VSLIAKFLKRNMEHTKQLGTERIGKLLTKFSIPAIIGMMVMASYNIVDRIFVGRGVGALAISGVTIIFPAIIVVMAFGMLIGIGSTSLVSLKLGGKKLEEAEKILGNALSLCLIINLALTLILWLFMDTILNALGATGEVFKYAKDYSVVILFGIIFQGIAFSLNSIVRGEGNPKMAMITIIFSAVLNAILNPIFIFYLHMGIKGSALATVLAQLIASIWIISYFLSKRSALKLRFKNLELDKRIILEILGIGFAPFMMQILASAVMFIANRNLEHYGGELAIAALGIINSVYMLFFMPVIGLNQGAQPIFGYNYGAKQYRRVRKALKTSIIAASMIMIFAFLVIMIFDEQIIRVFSKNNLELERIGSHGIRIFLFMLPVVGFQIISASYFQAVNKAKFAAILTLTRQGLILIPLLIILPHFWGIDGVWFSAPIADFSTSLLAITFLYLELKKLKLKEAEVISIQ
jgi:putative MATE family efflux protein